VWGVSKSILWKWPSTWFGLREVARYGLENSWSSQWASLGDERAG